MHDHSFHMVRTDEERSTVLELIRDVYIQKGYIRSEDNSSIGAYLSLDATRTFYACVEDTIVGTLSVVPDGPSGLPMDSIFKDELDRKRGEGLSMAEVCQFAIDKERVHDKIDPLQFSTLDVSISTGLIGVVLYYGLYKKFDRYVLAVNPKHSVFYKSIGCVQMGGERSYPSVNNAPAIAYTLNLSEIQHGENGTQKGSWMLKEIFKNPPDQRIFQDA